ncbi:unnamed protein product [Notodromas monacha]|uniref:Protein sleepless n=1 Tax=Notodromas monacha TaxID=399045 RepID=A0A7R9GCV5_9CRUS|nr:unnamed protein product [Notodromas monacha]CAG0916500.1 unnamed protein product [Notodromas monacha]
MADRNAVMLISKASGMLNRRPLPRFELCADFSPRLHFVYISFPPSVRVEMRQLWFVCAAVGFFFGAADGITCFFCHSKDDPTCRDSSTLKANREKFLIDCDKDFAKKRTQGTTPPENATYFCRKRQEIDTVFRTCGWELEHGLPFGCYSVRRDGVDTETCNCDTDACNSSPRRGLGMVDSLLTACAAVVLILAAFS